MMRYSVFIEDENLDVVTLRIETADENNEVLRVNRLIDYLIVKSDNPKSLWVEGVIEVSEDSDFSGLYEL